MLKKSFSLIVIFFLLTGCGYTPMFSNLDRDDMYIEIQNVEGDRATNNLIRKRLVQYQKNINAEKKYQVEIFSEYNKLVVD